MKMSHSPPLRGNVRGLRKAKRTFRRFEILRIVRKHEQMKLRAERLANELSGQINPSERYSLREIGR